MQVLYQSIRLLIDSMRECAFDEAFGADDVSDCKDYLFHVREWGGEQNSLIRSPSPGSPAFLQRIGCCIAIGNLLPLFEPTVLRRIWMCFAEEHERIAGPSDKAHAELMVDSNAILACPIITQLLHPVAGRNSQVLQLSGRVKHLATCNRCAP